MILFLLSVAYGAQISGSVWSVSTAIGNAQVYAFDKRMRAYETITDATGNFQFDDLPAGEYRLLSIPPINSSSIPLFYPDSRYHCSAEILRLTSNTTAEAHFQLPEGAALQGQLLNPFGVAEENTLIVAHSLEDDIPRAAFTDSDGNFRITGMHPLTSQWHCEVLSENWPEQFLAPTYDDDRADLFSSNQDIGTHHLLEGIYVSGMINGPNGPIDDATVTIYAGSQVKNVQSETDGSYEVQGLPPGDVLVWASAPEHATTYHPNHDRPTEFQTAAEEGSEMEGLDLFLPMDAKLSIKLLDIENQQPILGASVLLYNQAHTVGKGAPVDTEGVALIEGLHGGLYHAYIYAENDGYFNQWYADENGDPRWINLASEEERLLTIEQAPSANLTGSIMDDTGNPVYGADVIVSLGDDVFRTASNHDGEYYLQGLRPGEYEIQVHYSPYCPQDGGYVSVYYPASLTPQHQSTLWIAEQAQGEADFILPIDDDQDGMGDEWERENGLDPTRNDAHEDLDDDGIANLTEYQNGTDPNEQIDEAATECGCQDGKALLFLALVLYRRRLQL